MRKALEIKSREENREQLRDILARVHQIFDPDYFYEVQRKRAMKIYMSDIDVLVDFLEENPAQLRSAYIYKEDSLGLKALAFD